MHRTLFAGICICLLAGCADHAGTPIAPAAQEPVVAVPQDGGALPAPAEIARHVSDAPANDSGRVVLGTDDGLHLSLWTEQLGGFFAIAADQYRLDIRPRVHSKIGNGVPVAYQGYRFKPVDYNGPLVFHIEWQNPPSADDLYIGLADFDSNSWQWFTTEDPFAFSTEDAPRYHSTAGEIYLLLLVTNVQTYLRWVGLGDDFPPFAGFIAQSEVNPRGPVQFECSFDSFDVDGEIVKYEWDFNGDGDYELDNGDDPLAIGNFSREGTFSVALRVTDDGGNKAVATKEITINDWQSELIDGYRLVGFEIDGRDTLHVVNDDRADYTRLYFYSTNSGGGWQSEQIDADLLGEAAPWLMTLDHDGLPTLYCSSNTSSEEMLLQRDARGWVAYLGPQPRFDLPFYSLMSLRFDSENLPHFAAGTEVWQGQGMPGEPFDALVRYWQTDGIDWNMPFEDSCHEKFYGMGLDAAGTAYVGYSTTSTPGGDPHPIVVYSDSRLPGWVGETAGDEDVENARMVVAHDGTIHIVSLVNDLYYFRTESGWQPGPMQGLHSTIVDPGYELPNAADLILDDRGRPHLLRAPELLLDHPYWGENSWHVANDLYHAYLVGGAWQVDTVKSGGSGGFSTSFLRMNGAGEVHAVCMLRFDDPRYWSMRETPGRDQLIEQPYRLFHYWKAPDA